MIRFYLDEEPLLDNVTTYLLDDPKHLEAALARIGELVFKPTGESGGSGVVIGPATDARRLEELARTVRAEPSQWIAQEVVRLSTVPTVTAGGELVSRHVDLRPFAVFGEQIRIVPGGLTRVALEPGSMIVNSSRGGGSKDTWVLEDGARVARAAGAGRRPAALARPARPAPGVLDGAGTAAAAAAGRGLMLARIAHELFWLGRNVSRAEHTARMIDGVFQVDLQGRQDDPAGVTLSWESVLAIMGASTATDAPTRAETVALLSTDAANANSVVASVNRAREGARTVRDVISAEMWEAINSFGLGLADASVGATGFGGPYSFVSLREEPLGAVLGRRRSHDAARRGVRVPRRRRALRVGRHGAADAARRAAPSRARTTRPPATGRRSRCSARSAACRHSAARAPRRRRRLRWRASCSTRAATPTRSPRRWTRCATRSSSPTQIPAPRGPCCVSRACWPTSTSARAPPDGGASELLEVCEIVGSELALADGDITDRYFGGVMPPSHVT